MDTINISMTSIQFNSIDLNIFLMLTKGFKFQFNFNQFYRLLINIFEL